VFEVEATDEFTDWFMDLEPAAAEAVAQRIDLLAEQGPALRRPVVGEIKGSTFDPQMKELRVSVAGDALRVLFMFDPRRTAILLLGGSKTGTWNRWYRTAIPEADRLYEEHLATLRKEGD
jgi:hypothetical protein